MPSSFAAFSLIGARYYSIDNFFLLASQVRFDYASQALHAAPRLSATAFKIFFARYFRQYSTEAAMIDIYMHTGACIAILHWYFFHAPSRLHRHAFLRHDTIQRRLPARYFAT